MKKYVIAFLAIFVTMMISTATAVPQTAKKSVLLKNVVINKEDSENNVEQIIQKLEKYVCENPESTGIALAVELMIYFFSLVCVPVNTALIALLGPLGVVLSVIFDIFVLLIAFICGFSIPIPMS